MRSPLWVEGIGTKSSTGPSFLGPSRCGHPWGQECSFSIVTKDLPFFPGYSSWFGCLFSFFSSWALVLSYSALGYVVLWLGGSRVECSSLPHSFLWLSPLRVRLPEWSVQPFVAVPWSEPISVYGHIGVQFSR